MELYKLDTGIWYTTSASFSSDKEAWEELRKILPNKFATLYKQITIKLPIINEVDYTKNYIAKYGKSDKIDKHSYWVAILRGITDSEYDL